MAKAPWYPHMTVAAIIEQDGAFLCVEEHPRHDNVINQPAGHVEKDETIVEAIIRETLEETGYRFEPTELVGFYYFTGSNGVSYFRICFTGKVRDPLPGAQIDPDISGVHWLSLDALRHKKLRNPIVVESIEDYLAGNRYPITTISCKP